MVAHGPAGHHGPRVRATLSAARLAILWERLWRVAWAPAAVAAGLLGLLLMDVPRMIGPWPWLSLAALGLVVALWGVWRARRNLRWPGREEAQRRVELASALAHRPLAGLEDRQATGLGDTGAATLWALHRARLLAAAKGLRPGWPAPRVAERDRWGLRGMAVLLLVVGIVAAGGQWRDRLAQGVALEVPGAVAATALVTLDLYITPPAYTRQAPVYRSTVDGRPARTDARAGAAAAEGDAGRGPITVPEGSTLAARVNGAIGDAPILEVNAASRPFEQAGGSHEVEATVTSGRELVVTHGSRVLGRWAIEVAPDEPPTIEFAEPPFTTQQFALGLRYQATDDYGIAQARARLTLSPDAPRILDRPDLELELPVPGRMPTEVRGERVESLISHVWAGFPVIVELEAVDAAEQVGTSEPLAIVLPEFPFQHPVARALIDQRRTLLLRPEEARTVVETLETLSERPDRFYDDTVVFLAMRTAARRLAFAREIEPHVEPVQRLLWEAAMRLEGGELQMAMQRLRDLQEQLRRALQDPDATDEEIAELMDQLREAMNAYLEQMQQAMQQALEQGQFQQQMMEQDGESISREELQRMIDQMQNLSESGARDQAEQLLSELQRMMEGLVPMPSAQGQSAPQMQMLNDLQELMDGQRRLMDETFQQSLGEGDPEQGAGSADRQEQLRGRLDDLTERLQEMMGDSPESMGRAGEAMDDATQNLRGGRPDDAVGDQGRALEELQQGLAGLAEELMQQMAPGRDGRRDAATPDRRGRDRDPLGRPLRDSQSASTQDIRIPDEMDVQRAREILMELRHRLSQRERPTEELDYLERLLRLF